METDVTLLSCKTTQLHSGVWRQEELQPVGQTPAGLRNEIDRHLLLVARTSGTPRLCLEVTVYLDTLCGSLPDLM